MGTLRAVDAGLLMPWVIGDWRRRKLLIALKYRPRLVAGALFALVQWLRYNDCRNFSTRIDRPGSAPTTRRFTVFRVMEP